MSKNSKNNNNQKFHIVKFIKNLFQFHQQNNNDDNPLYEIFNFNPLASQMIVSYQRKISNHDKQQLDKLSTIFTIPSSSSTAMSNEDQLFTRTDNNNNINSSFKQQRLFNGTLTTNVINSDLIDLDLISGSAYIIKSKSQQQGWISMLFQSILRVIFFPLYLRWWSEQTNAFFVTILFLLYIMQIISIRFYYQKTTFLPFNNNNYNNNNNGTINNNQSSSATNSSTILNSNKSNEFSDIPATELLMPIAMMIVLGIIHTQIVGTKNFKSSSSSSFLSSSTSNNNNNSSISANNNNNIINNNNSNNRKNNNNNHHHHQHHNHSHNQTDCSSSSSSSSTSSSSSSSVDSSPVTNVRQRLHNRMVRLEKFKNDDLQQQLNTTSTNNNNINSVKPPLPKIRFCNENHSFDVDNDDVDDDENKMQKEFSMIKPRKRADSLPKSWTKSRKSNRLRVSTTKHSSSSTWNYDDDHLNSSPVSLRSSLYGSSFDSEGTISPMTPTILQENEWPASTDEENDNDEHHDDAYHSGDYSQITSNTTHTKSRSLNNNQTINNNDRKVNQHGNMENGPQTTNNATTSSTTTNNTVSNELKVSCSLWQHNNNNNLCQKYDLSVVDISSSIIRKVETVEHSNEYFYLGILFSLTISLIPSIYRLQYSTTKDGSTIAQILHNTSLAASVMQPSSLSPTVMISTQQQQQQDLSYLSDLYGIWNFFLEEAFYLNRTSRVRFVIITAMIERFVLSLIFFFLLCVTERTFKQRFLYSKYFSHITRRDRAKRSQIPHFRLHKVRNLKVWLSVRSYLRRYGPHRSVDTICSTTFIISICLLTCISLQILKDSNESCTQRLICWEMIFWSLAMGIYIMRLMILGSRINQKYRSNLSVLITEQINLYLQLERKPHKKDALMLANQVLKLAVDLLKELESPYKISGFSANPYLYNITKVVVLSAFSAVLTEMLGFKLKLYKIKLIR